MKNQTGATMLVAGTCIGGGTIAIPLVLAKVGILPSLALMLIMCFVVYSTAIINLELHLQAKQGMSLGNLCRKFSGKAAESFANINFKLLSYSLLAAYIYGGTSILQTIFDIPSFTQIASFYAAGGFILLLCSPKLIDYINRILFLALLAIVAILILGLISEVKWNNLPYVTATYSEISVWAALIPVLFTSFGFQGSIPAIVKYCDNDECTLKKAFFWGSIIPAIVYIIWTCSVLAVLYANNYTFFLEIIAGKIEIGQLVKELGKITQWHFVQILVWSISLLAIITSFIGVGIGLFDSLKSLSPKSNNFVLSFLTVFPAYIIAILIPNAFITMLSFAGVILAIIAIFIPIYLINKTGIRVSKELQNNYLINFILICGIIIIDCEILNML